MFLIIQIIKIKFLPRIINFADGTKHMLTVRLLVKINVMSKILYWIYIIQKWLLEKDTIYADIGFGSGSRPKTNFLWDNDFSFNFKSKI